MMKLDLKDIPKQFRSEVESGGLLSHRGRDMFVRSGGTFSTFKLRRAYGLEDGFSVPSTQVKGVNLNLEILKGKVTYNSAQVAARAIVAVLKASQLRVPHDTGELKASGRATIDIGRGKKGGYRVYVIAKGNMRYGNATLENLKGKITREMVENSQRIVLRAGYNRVGTHGEDVALIAHELFHPYGSGIRPMAQRPGTGPKYLEIPFNQIKGTFVKDLLQSITKITADIRNQRVIQKKAKNKYMVDIIRLKKSYNVI